MKYARFEAMKRFSEAEFNANSREQSKKGEESFKAMENLTQLQSDFIDYKNDFMRTQLDM